MDRHDQTSNYMPEAEHAGGESDLLHILLYNNASDLWGVPGPVHRLAQLSGDRPVARALVLARRLSVDGAPHRSVRGGMLNILHFLIAH